MKDVWNAIAHSRLLIAECTGKNANVFYELGIAHCLGKQVILITQDKADIPFDLSHYRYIEYTETPRGRKKLEQAVGPASPRTLGLANTRTVRALLLFAIRVYQHYVSPLKGFRCAYHVHTGRASCSWVGLRAVPRYGPSKGIAVARERTRLCGVAHRRYGVPANFKHAAQRGVCDLPCDLPDVDCDLPSGKSVARVCDVLSCCDCGSCDWPERRKRRKSDKDDYVPPRRRNNAPVAQTSEA